MKMTKRILTLALCIIMVMSLSVTAFASNGHNHTITITNPNDGDYEYTAYQIFEGNLGSTGVLGNVQWGENVDGNALLAELQMQDAYKECTSASMVAKVLAGATANMDDPIAVAFAEIAAKYVTDSGKKSGERNAKGHYEITGLEDGYYLVMNTGMPADATNTTVSRYILEVVRDISVVHKGYPPKVEKKINENGNLVDLNSAGLGQTVKYDIVATMPANIDRYDSYPLTFVDTLSKGLTFKPETLRVTVNGVEVTKYFAVTYTENDGSDNTIKIGMDIMALEYGVDANGNPLTVGEITTATKVVVTYDAVVNVHAVVAGPNPNEVKILYDRDPNQDTPPYPPTPPENPKDPPEPEGETPPDRVETWLTELTILKTDGASKPLTGAQFTLEGDLVKTFKITRQYYRPVKEGETGTHWELKNTLEEQKWTTQAPVFEDDPATEDIDERTADYYVNPTPNATHIIDTVVERQNQTEDVKIAQYVGTDGYLTFTGLAAGQYKLTETVTPAGFNTIAPIEFTVTFDERTQKFNIEGTNLLWPETDNTLYGIIVNQAGTTLPSTGGIGTTLFYIIGGLMFAGAAVLLITKKRMTA